MSDIPNVTYNDKTHQLRLDGKVLPTSTGISGMLDKPGLPWGAAGETALFAIHHREEWENLSAEAAYERLRKHHRGVWNDKANRGTRVHDLAMQWAGGNDVECPEDCTPYLDALERFYTDHDPIWVEVERNILSLTPGLEYGGKFDYVRQTATENVQGDIKTGKRYPIETTLQVASYAFAQYLATYENNKLVALDPMPKIDRCEVLYLHDDTTYELLTLPVTPAVYEHFLSLRAAWSWLREMDAWLKKHPEPERGELVVMEQEAVA